jgi:hypothetical protein
MGMRDDFLPVADREPKIKRIRALFVQQDGENLIVNETLHVRRRAGQHLVQIQRCVDFLADFRQDRQRLRRDLQLRIESS